MKITIENGTLKDERGNRATIEYWGSEEAARKSLESLVKCLDCVNCEDCDYCSEGVNCVRCFSCRQCSECSDCVECNRSVGLRFCSWCCACRELTRCSDCSDRANAEDCHGSDNPMALGRVPAIPNIHRDVFQAASKPGCLEMSAWHCGTAHCRAGWVVTLAGEAGRKLEARTSTLFAAQQIYHASGYDISPERFFDDEDYALADMKRLAELEQEEEQPCESK